MGVIFISLSRCSATSVRKLRPLKNYAISESHRSKLLTSLRVQACAILFHSLYAEGLHGPVAPPFRGSALRLIDEGMFQRQAGPT